MTCPRCKLVNPPEALKCDCGYDFASRVVGPSLLRGSERKPHVPASDRPSLKKAAYLILSALFAILVSAIPEITDSVGPLLRLLGFGLWLSGTITWASAKGWHWGWGLLGISGIGALAIALMPDHTRNPYTQARSSLIQDEDGKVVSTNVGRRYHLRIGMRQKVLVVFASLLALVALFPPWSYTFDQPGMATVHKPAPRSFLFSPPAPEQNYPNFGVLLDFKRLCVELLSTVFLGGAVNALANRADRRED
jgi:hypothetical protein